MEAKDPVQRTSPGMTATDYAEILLLVKRAEKALFSGQLNEWQHANTTTFHILASMILDLNARLLAVGGAYPSTNQSLVATSEAVNGI